MNHDHSKGMSKHRLLMLVCCLVPLALILAVSVFGLSLGAATAAPNVQPSASAFETKSSSGGSVTVDVKPTALQVGQPIVFDIALNTHSVDLSDDLTKIAILRDDTGGEYKPTAWEGAGPGGHHREGALKFAALTRKPKYVELVIKGLATVPERVFRWDLS